MKFKVPVTWKMYGYMYVEAETKEDAVKEAYSWETPLPQGNYLDDSFEVDEDFIEP